MRVKSQRSPQRADSKSRFAFKRHVGSLVNMATLMRCMRSVCTILEPTLTLRISERYVRTVRRRPSITSSEEEEETDWINLKSGVKDEQVKGPEGLKRASSPSALESMREENQRNVCQKHEHTTRKVSESHPEKTTSKKASLACGLSSKPPCFSQMEGLRYEKAQPDDKRVL